VQARFHRYSFANTVLILCQCPTASRVAGFHTWRRLGRQVRRGEHAIWILAPVTRRVDADDASEQSTRVVAGFRPVPVFAEDQTDGDPLPEVCARLGGDDPRGAYAGLLQVASLLGFTVEDHAFDGETNGDCSHALRRIRIEVTLAPAHRAKTLAHELAHALLHADASDRALAELEAESVAFIVCDALGLDAGTWTFGYVAGWAGGGDEAVAAIKAAGARIQRTADQILSALDRAEEARSEPVGAAES
jgi:antirestriction protein ArdC